MQTPCWWERRELNISGWVDRGGVVQAGHMIVSATAARDVREAGIVIRNCGAIAATATEESIHTHIWSPIH